MKLRTLTLLAVLSIFVISLTVLSSPALAADKTFKWRLATLYPRGVTYGVVYESLAEKVKTMSDGRLTIEIVYDGEGVAATEVFSAVKTGLVEMGVPFMALHAGEMPAGVVELGLPGAVHDFLQIRTLFYNYGWDKAVEKAYGKHGIQWIAEWSSPETYLLTKKPIKSIADLKQMKIRAPGPSGAFLKYVGAAPVTMAFGEVYTSLATGVIDGVDGTNIIDIYDGKFHEVAKYLYPLPILGSETTPILVNMNAWKKLPQDLQAILTIAARWCGTEWGMLSLRLAKSYLQEMKAAGMEVTEMPSPEDQAKWAEAADKVWQEYEAIDEDCANLIKIQRAFKKELSIK